MSVSLNFDRMATCADMISVDIPIGERIEVREDDFDSGKKQTYYIEAVEVKRSNKEVCKRCYFCDAECSYLDCDNVSRRDHKNVMFKRVNNY